LLGGCILKPLNNIRAATLSDVPQLRAFQLEAWEHDYLGYVPEAYIPVALELYASEEALAKTVELDRYYFVAEDEQGLCGCLAGVHTSEHEAEIFWLHVARRSRGQGLGKKLVEHLFTNLEPQIHTLHVVTFQANIRALAFYKSLGFETFKNEVDDHDGILVHNVRLKRSVHSPPGG
jgi:ribosomal protein S18 acetylase RimI-like enzyme